MTKFNNLIVIGAALIISAAIWIVMLNKDTKRKKITATIFQGLNGWGYDILVNDKLFIHQESIPAQLGKTGFTEKKQAEKTARLIINKMERGELPTVTTFELEQIIPLK